MRRKLRPLAVLAIAIVALVMPIWLVHATLPSPTAYDVIAGEFNATIPVPLELNRSGERELTVDAPRLPNMRDVEVAVEVGTYTRPPSQTIRLDLLGAQRKLLRSCRIPPTDYTDNGTVACPVARPDRVRRIGITVRGAPLAVYAANDRGKLVAGTLVQKQRLSGLDARLDALRERVAVTRPALVSPILLFVAFAASIALLGTGLLLATGRE